MVTTRLLLSFALIATPAPALAATFTWIGPNGGDLAEPAHWSPAGPPGPADIAEVPAGPAITVVAGTQIAFGRLSLRRPVTVTGAPIELFGVLDATSGENVLFSTTSSPVVECELVLRASGTFTSISTLGATTARFAGAIRDGGAPVNLALRPSSPSTMQLEGASTYAGSTTLFVTNVLTGVRAQSPQAFGTGPLFLPGGGTVRLATDHLATDIVAGGTVHLVAEAAETRLQGVISGSGGRLNFGNAAAGNRIVLASANTFDKPVSVLSGSVLRVEHASALGTVQGNTALLLGAALELSGGLLLTEPIDLEALAGSATIRNVSGDNVLAAAVTPGPLLIADVAAGSLRLASSVTVNLEKVGPGVLELAGTTGGAVTQYTVREGTLRVTGTLSSDRVDVLAGAVLGGTGTIIGDVSVAGTLAPGDPFGPLAVDGDVELTGTMAIELDAPGDALVAFGAHMLSIGGVLVLAGAPQAEAAYMIVNAGPDTMVAGTFAGLAEGTVLDGLRITYAGGDGNDVVLEPEVSTCSDTGPPIVSGCPQDVTVECTGGGAAQVSWLDPTAADDCDPQPVVFCSPPAGSAFALGDATVTCDAADAGGNATSGACVFTARVVDTTPPVVTCPADQVVTANAGSPVTFAEAEASDVCGAAPVVCAPASGAILAPGSYTVSCSATDGAGLGGACSFALEVRAANDAPRADAGPDQNVAYTVSPPLVMLDGCASSDDGLPDPPGALAYVWTQISGAPVVLAGASACAASFTAPVLAAGSAEMLTFELTVSDGELESSNTTGVLVTNTNHPPECHASAPEAVAEAVPGVVLDGSGSFDPDGDTLSWSWIQLGGPAVELQGGASALALFDAPPVDGPEVLVFELTVSDGALQVACTLEIAVEAANHCPLSSTPSVLSVVEGASVTLDGSASSDADGDTLVFAWTQISGPPVQLTGPSSAVATFVAPDLPGGEAELVFQLTADDGDGCPSSALVTVHVTAAGTPPSCAGAYAAPAKLWPPNHRMHAVKIKGVPGHVTVDAIHQDEPTGGGWCFGARDGVIRHGRAFVRAERAGHGNGRVYVLSFTASGPDGTCSGAVKVCVPHSKKRGCVDDGAVYDSTGHHP